MSLLPRPSTASAALVLRAWPCGETSAVVSLLTAEQGFVKVVAKGAYGERSRLRPLISPGRLVVAEFSLDPLRDLQYLRGGSVVLDPLTAQADLEVSAYLLAGLELVDRCRPSDGLDQAGVSAGLFPVCEEFVQMLSSPTCQEPALAFFACEWVLLARYGTAPVLDACCGCGATGLPGLAGPLRFSPADGGILCQGCGASGLGGGGRPLSGEAHELLLALAEQGVQLARRSRLARALRREIGGLLHQFLGYHLPGYRLPAALELLRAGRDDGQPRRLNRNDREG